MKSTFTQLAENYTTNERLIQQLWNEIETTFSHPKRHYHTLHHLEQLFNELSAVKEHIQNWDTVLFSLFYHDIVYNPLRRDNEERSVIIAEDRLQSIDVPANLIETCKKQIMCTKTHEPCKDKDSNFFTDADLSILGQDEITYKEYASAIRKEYALYADNLYYPGRKAVLNHFLQMERIFKTEPFFNKYEKQARKNLQQEIESIGKY
jgi:predicted metal-dependent HD superfamily phosphohydrolase